MMFWAEREMASEAEKGKSTTSEGGAARPRARRSPTLTEMVDAVMDQVNESRLAQEAIRLEALRRLEKIEETMTNMAVFVTGLADKLRKLDKMEQAMADVSVFVTKIHDTQSSQDAVLRGLQEKVESLQKQLKESPLKQSAEVPPAGAQQGRQGAAQPQPVPRMRVKVCASKRPQYLDSDSESPRERHPKRTRVAPESQGAEKPPSESPRMPTPPTQPPSPKPEGAPSASGRAPQQQHPSKKATQCPKCNFMHKGNCTVPRNTCFRCLQPGHVAKECQGELVCGNCREPGHLQKGCLKKRVAPSE